MDKKDHRSRDDDFVDWLIQLANDRDDHSQKRAALAVLRRGLGRYQGRDFFLMYPWIGRFLPHNGLDWENKIYFIVASLFALHPLLTAEGNMGGTLAEVKRRIELRSNTKNDSTDKRFIALLSCHRDDLDKHLRHIISLAKSHEVAVNWLQLLKDIRFWNWEEGRVQRNWAHEYWAYHGKAELGDAVALDAEEDNLMEEVQS